MIDKKDIRLFRGIREIAGMIYKYVSPRDVSPNILYLEDKRHSIPNPLFNQTETGLFIEIQNGRPKSIYTPWGEWECWGNSDQNKYWRNVLILFLDRLDAKEFKPLKNDFSGSFGPVYSIPSIDGIPLPEPQMRVSSEYLSELEAISTWKGLELAAVPWILEERELRQ